MKQINRRNFLKTASVAATIPFLSRCGQLPTGGKRPNLVFIFADQLRADALGYAGNTKAITPNIDRFASQSVNFTNAVSVMPVCAAFRASLFTGKYPSTHGMVINELNMNPNHRSIAHILGDNGYNLGYVGKWHLNDQHKRPTPKGPERLGFDGYWAAYSFNHRSYKSYYYTDDNNGELQRIDLEGKHGPEEFTDLTMNYIESISTRDEPFALFLSWNPPHDPWRKDNVPEANYEKFEDVKFELPHNFSSIPDPYMDRYFGYAYEGKTKWKKDFVEGGLEECIRCYYGMVNDLDFHFGRVMEKLTNLGLTDDTIVVFTSDHGEMFGSQGRMAKLTFYDEASRVPFLVRYPKVIEKGNSDICLNTPDIMPTLLSLMGMSESIPSDVEGSDLSFALKGITGDEPEAAFLQGLGHTYRWIDGFEWRAVRDKRFTYAKYLRDGKELLFDRKNDPFSKKDVINDPSYSENLSRLRKFMNYKLNELNDGFHKCSWYRDNWMYKEYSIEASAKGEFGPLSPIEPNRKSRK